MPESALNAGASRPNRCHTKFKIFFLYNKSALACASAVCHHYSQYWFTGAPLMLPIKIIHVLQSGCVLVLFPLP